MAVPKFKLWEKVLILVATLVFLSAMALYVQGVSLSEVLFGVEDYSQKVEVGQTGDQAKSVKRKTQESNQFKEISGKTPLYNYDTIVTSPDQSAQIQFNDGSVVELAPGTMIRLSFESALSLTGITHMVKLDVVSGTVEPKAIKRAIKFKSGDETVELSSKNFKKVQAPPTRVVHKLDVATAPSKPVMYYKANPPPAPTPVPIPLPVIAAVTPTPAPTPLPTPPSVHLTIIAPAQGLSIPITTQTNLAAIPVQLRWALSAPGQEVEVEVKKVAKKDVLITKITKKLNSKIQFTNIALSQPGRYLWRIYLKSNPREHKESEFKIGGDLKGFIHLSSPETDSKGNSSAVKLKWSGNPSISEYKVNAYHDAAQKLLIWSRVSKTNQLPFDVKSLIEKKMDPKVYFDVTASTAGGFNLTSNQSFIEFAFFNTHPIVPGDNEKISIKTLAKEQRKLIFTWEKKNLATAYTFEVASDPAFKQIVHRVGTRENYVPLEALKPGIYYWRIRVAILGIWGPTSNAHSFQMKE